MKCGSLGLPRSRLRAENVRVLCRGYMSWAACVAFVRGWTMGVTPVKRGDRALCVGARNPPSRPSCFVGACPNLHTPVRQAC